MPGSTTCEGRTRFGLWVAAMLGWAPIPDAAVIVVQGTVLVRCVSMEESHRAIGFQAVLLIAALALPGCATSGPEPSPGQASRDETVLDSVPLGELAARFLAGGEGYEAVDVGRLEAAIEAELSPPDPASVFLTSGRFGPFAKAILALEATDGVLPRVRYRVLYGLELVAAPPAADPVPVSFVQVDRFNLGPAIRDELMASLGAEQVAPPDAFGVGPHVSWRLVLRPVMGQAAAIVAAGRAELSDSVAHDSECLGASCMSTAGEMESAMPWSELEPLAWEPDVVASTKRDGLPTPAAAIELLAAEASFEPRESLAFAEPFAEAVLEVDLGQDTGLDAALRDGELMDDSVAAAWRRLVALGGRPGARPQLFTARAFECRRGPQIPPPGELCP